MDVHPRPPKQCSRGVFLRPAYMTRKDIAIQNRNAGEWRLVARRVHSPPFSRRGGCAIIKRSRSSAAQTGWLVSSNKNKVRFADIHKEATRPFINHPVCAAKDASQHLFDRAATPALKTEGNGPISQPTPFPVSKGLIA